MTCPMCGAKTYVTDSRAECDVVYRQRRCDECGHVFYTVEVESESKEDINRLKRERKQK